MLDPRGHRMTKLVVPARWLNEACGGATGGIQPSRAVNRPSSASSGGGAVRRDCGYQIQQHRQQPPLIRRIRVRAVAQREVLGAELRQ